MKFDEAKKYLNRLRIGRSASGKDDKPTQALDIAIKSLEIWAQLKETLTEMYDNSDDETLKDFRNFLINYMTVLEKEGVGNTALDMAVKALEQEPCEDCVSREAVLEHICEGKECYKEECKGRTLKRCPDLQWVFDLPSVKPQEPRTDVLDKIKAEIDSYCSDNRDKNDGLYIAMQIIDKYKGGSEG